MQATLNEVNAALQLAGAENVAGSELPHPFQAAKLGYAPFRCVGCDIGEARCAYCTTPLKYLYKIQDRNGTSFIVGSECVKQTGGAVAEFEKFNRQMAARVRELQKQARALKAEATKELAFAKWKEANAAEWAYIQKRASGGNGFYAFLQRTAQQYGSLFDSRLSSVRADMQKDAERAQADERLAAGAAVRKEERAQAAPVVTLEPVEAAFAKAKAAGVQYPALRLGSFVFSPAGANSANAGGIYIKTGKVSGGMPGAYLGKVLNGKFFASRECSKDQEADILAISKDPKAAALAYGKKYGKCSVCNRDLSDPASVEAGIGPICAQKYGF